MNDQKLIEYVAELEARLKVAEKFIYQIAQLNELEMPTDAGIKSEMIAQLNAAKAKYQQLLQ